MENKRKLPDSGKGSILLRRGNNFNEKNKFFVPFKEQEAPSGIATSGVRTGSVPTPPVV